MGDSILVADGNLNLKVEEKDHSKNLVTTRVLNDYMLYERKNMNLPGNRVFLSTITEKDKYDLINFTLEEQIDFVSVSFCRSAEDIR